MNTIKYLLFVTAILIGLNATAKSDENDIDNKKKNKSKVSYIGGIGWGFLTEWGTTKSFAQYDIRYGYNSVTQTYGTDTNYLKQKTPLGFSILNIGYNGHIIFKQYSKEKSLSVNFYPSVGFGFARTKFLNVTVPVSINLNHGNVSTLQSKKDYGTTVGVGIEYLNAGIVQFGEEDGEGELYFGADNSIYARVQPFATFGFRYFNKNDKAKELNFKLGMTSSKVLDLYNKMPASASTSSIPFWARLSFVSYLGY